MYYIYHIKGVKIGCSKNPEERTKKQGYSEYEILENHSDINVASRREIELQKEYGYKVDQTLYSQTVSVPSKESLRKGGSIAWNIRAKRGDMAKMGSISGKKNAEKIQTCEYCGKTIKGLNYNRWHGERCKHKNT